MPALPPRIVLIGLRGSGKTTLGRALADRRQAAFVDLDDLTIRRLGCDSVAQAWEHHGEPAFREAEVHALRQALTGDAAVIALGGGTPMTPEARRMIEEHRRMGGAVVVYLRCEPGVLRDRLVRAGADAVCNRPSLTGGGTLEEIDAVYAQRDPVYLALADLVIENAASAEEALRRIEKGC